MTGPFVDPFKKDNRVDYKSPLATPKAVPSVPIIANRPDVIMAQPGKPEVEQTPAAEAYSKLDKVDRSRTPMQMTPDEMEHHKGWTIGEGAGAYGTDLEDVSTLPPDDGLIDLSVAAKAYDATVGFTRQTLTDIFGNKNVLGNPELGPIRTEENRKTADRANRLAQQSLNDRWFREENRIGLPQFRDPESEHWNPEDDTYYYPYGKPALSYLLAGKIKNPKTGEDIEATLDILTDAGFIPRAINPETGQAITEWERHAMAEELQPLSHLIGGGAIIDPINFLPFTPGGFIKLYRFGSKALTTSLDAARAFPKYLDYVPKVTADMRRTAHAAGLAAALLPTGMMPGGGGGVPKHPVIGPWTAANHALTKAALEDKGMYRSLDETAEFGDDAEILTELQNMKEAGELDVKLQHLLLNRADGITAQLDEIIPQIESGVPNPNPDLPDPTDLESLNQMDDLTELKTQLEREYTDIRSDIELMTQESERRFARSKAIESREVKVDVPPSEIEQMEQAMQSAYTTISGDADNAGLLGDLIDAVNQGRSKGIVGVKKFITALTDGGWNDEVLTQVGVRIGGQTGLRRMIQDYSTLASSRGKGMEVKDFENAREAGWQKIQDWVEQTSSTVTPGSVFTKSQNLQARADELQEALNVVNSPDFPSLIGQTRGKKQPFQIKKLNDGKAANKAVDTLLEKKLISQNGAKLIRWWIKAQESILDSPHTFDPEVFKVMNDLPPAYQWEMAGNEMMNKLWLKWDRVSPAEIQRWGPEAGTRFWTKRHYAMFGSTRGDVRRSMRDIEHGEIIQLQKKADDLATHEAVVVIDRDHPYGAIVTMERRPKEDVVDIYRSLGDEEFNPEEFIPMHSIDPDAQAWLDVAMLDDTITIIPLSEATPLKVLEESTRMLIGETGLKGSHRAFPVGSATEVVTMMQARPREAYSAWLKIKAQYDLAVREHESLKEVLLSRGGYRTVIDEQGVEILEELPNFGRGSTSPSQVRSQRAIARDIKERKEQITPFADPEARRPKETVRRRGKDEKGKVIIETIKGGSRPKGYRPVGYRSTAYKQVARWIAVWKQLEIQRVDTGGGGLVSGGGTTTRNITGQFESWRPRTVVAQAENPVPSNLGFSIKPYFDPQDVPESMLQTKFSKALLGKGQYMDDQSKVQLVYDSMEKHLRPDVEVRMYTPEEMFDYVNVLHSRLALEMPFILLKDTNVLEMIELGARPAGTLYRRVKEGERFAASSIGENWDSVFETPVNPRTGKIKPNYGGPQPNQSFTLQYAGGVALENGIRRILESTGSQQGKITQIRALLSSPDLVPGGNTDAWTELAALIWKANITPEVSSGFLRRIKDQFGRITIESHPSSRYVGTVYFPHALDMRKLVARSHPMWYSDTPYVAPDGSMNPAAVKAKQEEGARGRGAPSPDDALRASQSAPYPEDVTEGGMLASQAAMIKGGEYTVNEPEWYGKGAGLTSKVVRQKKTVKATDVEANQKARAEEYDDPDAKLAEIQEAEGNGDIPVDGSGGGRDDDVVPNFQQGEDGDLNSGKENWVTTGLLNLVKRFLDDTAWAKRISNLAAKSYKARTGRDLDSFSSSEVMLSLARSAPAGVRERMRNISTQFRAIAARSIEYKLDDFEYFVNEVLVYKQFLAMTARPELAAKTLRMTHRVTGESNIAYGRAGVLEKMAHYEALPEYGLLEEAADVVRGVYKKQLDDMVSYGLVKAETASWLRAMYPDYVPIQYIEAELRNVVRNIDDIKPLAKSLTRDPILRYDVPTAGGYLNDTLNAKFKMPTHAMSQSLIFNEYMGRLNKAVINFVEEKRELFESGISLTDAMVIEPGRSTKGDALRRAFPGRSDMKVENYVTLGYREDGISKAIVLPKNEAEVFMKAIEDSKPSYVSHYFNKILNQPMKAVLIHYNPTFPIYQLTIDMFAVAHQYGLSAAFGGTTAELYRSLLRKLGSKPDDFIVRMNELVGAHGWHTKETKNVGMRTDASDWVHNNVKEIIKKLGAGYDDVLVDNVPRANIARLSMKEVNSLNPLLGIKQGWRNFASELEMAPRRAAARHVYNKGMKTGARANDEIGSALNAALALKRSTGDFTRGGTVTRALDGYFAFINISAQGIALPFRAAKNHPKEFGLMMAGMTGANIALFNHNKSNPAYYDVPLQYRQGFIIMQPSDPSDINKTTGRPNPRFIRLPIPGHLREWAMLYGTQTHVMETLHKGLDKGAPEGLFGEWLENMIFGEINPTGAVIRQTGAPGSNEQWWGKVGLGTPGLALNLAVSTAYNINPYSGDQLIPEYMLEKPLEDQWHSGTSITARKIGPQWGISPMKLDPWLDLPLVREAVSITDTIYAATENNVSPFSIIHAKEIWLAIEGMTDAAEIENLTNQYMANNVPQFIGERNVRSEVKNIIRQMERGVPVLGEVQFEGSDGNDPSIIERAQYGVRTIVGEGGRNLPFYGTMTDRVMHQHAGTLHKYAKKRAHDKVGASTQETDKYLNSFRKAAIINENLMWELDRVFDADGNTRRWRDAYQDAQVTFQGGLDYISAQGSDKAIANRESYTQEESETYWKEYGKVMEDYGGASQPVKDEIHYRLYRELRPIAKLDKNGAQVQGEFDWGDFFDRQDAWLENLSLTEGPDAVTTLKAKIESRQSDQETLFRTVRERSVKPYFQETKQKAYREFGYQPAVDAHVKYHLMPSYEQVAFKNSMKNIVEMNWIQAIDTLILVNKKVMRAENQQLETDLVMYGYIANSGPLSFTGLIHEKSMAAWEFLADK
tara:strand:+ start:2158 stop:10422 length:8265 start_codon:yes stop_codon:yes gene_type:complete